MPYRITPSGAFQDWTFDWKVIIKVSKRSRKHIARFDKYFLGQLLMFLSIKKRLGVANTSSRKKVDSISYWD